MKLFSLFHALVGAYIRHEKGRSLLTVLGVALGVGVLVAIDLANESAVESFRNTVNDVAGEAQLEVRGNGIGLPGPTFSRVARHPSIKAIEPIISGEVSFQRQDNGTTVTLMLLGVDLLGSGDPVGNSIRDIQFILTEGIELTDLLRRPDLLLFTERFARRHGIAPGDRVTLHAAGFPGVYQVGGLLGDGTFADTLDGNLVLGDLAVADVILRRRGLLDRLDLKLVDGADVDKVAGEIHAYLGEAFVVERPQSRSARVDNMLAAFRFNLRALGHISILVGAFLVYNTMSIAVVRRRAVIGTVRALGVGRKAIRGVFLLEGVLIGLLGTAVGILGGVLAAGFLLNPVSEAISINFVQIHQAGLHVGKSVLIQALILGVGGATLAALGPANEAASTPPANTMRRGSDEVAADQLPWGIITVGGVLFLIGMVLLSREPRPGLPLSGYLASTFLIGAFSCWSRPCLGVVSALARRPFSLFFRVEGLLAVSSTRSALGRSSVAISGLLVSVAMTIAVTVMVASFRGTVTSWMEQVLVADLYISAATGNPGGEGTTMPLEFATRIGALEGVSMVDPFRTWVATINDLPVRLGSGDFRVPRFTSIDKRGRPMQEVLALARANRSAVASEAFSMKQGLGEGDLVHIPTPGGLMKVRIEGI